MNRISVVIATHNRPELLREAIRSVARQSYPAFEIIIVDDGSQPPVGVGSLQKEFGPLIQVIRNDQPMKQAYARDQGVQAATGDLVTHLDDDDLLAPTALELALAAITGEPSLDLVYLGVKGFGEKAADFDASQEKAMESLLRQAKGRQGQASVVQFGPELFGALLSSVPMAFQRSIEYRTVWNKVSALRRRIYMLERGVTDEEQAMARLQPPLRESEWALYAAACCKTALLMKPVYLQRCGQQGFFSVASQSELALRSNVDIKVHLFVAAKDVADFKPWAAEIKRSLAQAYLAQSYFYFNNGRRRVAYSALINALRIRPAASYLRFGLRMLLPRGRA